MLVCSGDPEHPLLLYLHAPRSPEEEPPSILLSPAKKELSTSASKRPPPGGRRLSKSKTKETRVRPQRVASSAAWNGVVVTAAEQI
ncbi:MAG: hypothetical protein SGPRY_014526, partial [Prymnesium sp.]